MLGLNEYIVIGSQSVLGAYPNVRDPPRARMLAPVAPTSRRTLTSTPEACDMTVLRILLILLPATPAIADEEPDYELVRGGDDYEIREYAPYLVAETTVGGGFDETGNAAFKRLAGYIFGDNRKPDAAGPDADESMRMKMTVPVTRHRDGGSTVYRFVMERAYDRDSLPVPNDERVTIRRVPGGTVAVLRYRGRITAARFAEQATRLRAALERDRLQPVGEAVSAVYNGPFTPPFLRRNEVLIRLAPPAP